MSDETAEVTAELTTTEPAPETKAETQPDATPAPEDVTKEAAPKTFTQAELDAIVQKEKAKAAAIAERRATRERIAALEARIPVPQANQQPASDRPTRSQFADDDDYVEAMADWKLVQRDKQAHQEQQQRAAQSIAAKTESIYAEAAKIPGFDREAFDDLPLTPAIAAVLVDSEVSAKLAHYLSQHPDEVAKIGTLSPARQAAAIGKLEDKLSAAPVTSKAPEPIKPIGTGGKGAHADLASMPYEEYKAYRAKQGASWARR